MNGCEDVGHVGSRPRAEMAKSDEVEAMLHLHALGWGLKPSRSSGAARTRRRLRSAAASSPREAWTRSAWHRGQCGGRQDPAVDDVSLRSSPDGRSDGRNGAKRLRDRTGCACTCRETRSDTAWHEFRLIRRGHARGSSTTARPSAGLDGLGRAEARQAERHRRTPLRELGGTAGASGQREIADRRRHGTTGASRWSASSAKRSACARARTGRRSASCGI